MFGNFQKETLEENGSGSTVSLDSNSTSARGTKGSWGWGEGTGTNPWCLAVSSAPAVWTGPSPPVLPVQFCWTSQSLSSWDCGTSFMSCFPPSSGWMVSSQAHAAALFWPFPPTLPPPLIPLVLSASFLWAPVTNFIMWVFANKRKHLFLKNPFPLTRLGPLWPRKTAVSSLLQRFLPSIQFHRRLVRLKQGWGGAVSSNKLPGVHGVKYNRATTPQRGLALSNSRLGPTACQ